MDVGDGMDYHRSCKTARQKPARGRFAGLFHCFNRL